MSPPSSSTSIPFSSLPLEPSGPKGNAWGRFGPADQLGTLNLLSPAVVAAAAAEIQTGDRIALDLPLDTPQYPSFGRKRMTHRIEQRVKGDTPDRPVNDDHLEFNTQGSSQWDGFRHYGYLDAKVYYNGTRPEAIYNSRALGIHNWTKAGGIVSRGILLDYAHWASCQIPPLTVSHFETSTIPVSNLESVAASQSLTIRPGDVLFVRSGWTAAFRALSDAEQRALAQRPESRFIGVESAEGTLRWLWEQQFAAVAGDMPGFESTPVGAGGDGRWVLHEWLLAGWGMPIGEMFDLEELAEHCRRVGRWSFFLSSVPLNVPGGVASPPNAVAIF